MKRAALPYAAVALAASSWGTWALIIRHAEAIAPMPAALESAIVMAVVTIVAGAMSLRDRADRGDHGTRPRTWDGTSPATPGRGRNLERTSPAMPGRGRNLRPWLWVGWFGVADMMNVLLFFAAYKLTIAPAVLTHYLMPVFVAAAAPLVLRERMTARTGAAIVVSLVGLAIMLGPSVGASHANAVWTSAALGTASALFYASNVFANKFLVGVFSASEAMFWHGIVATILGVLLVPLGAWATVDAHAVAFLAVAAIGPGALGGVAFVWGLRRMPAAHASTLTLLEPLVSVLLGAVVLGGETVSVHAAAGGALILSGAVVVMSQGGQARTGAAAVAAAAGQPPPPNSAGPPRL